MTQSSKLGVASAVLLVSIAVPPYATWREPINFAAVGLSFVLGLIAAQRGSKWWLAIPCTIIAGCAGVWYLAAHSF
jgi:hypothetical protein